MFVSDMVGSKNVKVEKLPKTIFEERDGSTTYSITKGIFYIKELGSRQKCFRARRHIKYEKPTDEFTFKKVQAEIVLKNLMRVCQGGTKEGI